MRDYYKKFLVPAIIVLVLQLSGCANTAEQVQAHPSQTGRFVVPQPLSIVIINFMNEANNVGGDSDVITKFVPGQFGIVEDVTQPISSICYTVDFKSVGGSTEVTYYLAGGMCAFSRGNFRAWMIAYANGQRPPFW